MNTGCDCGFVFALDHTLNIIAGTHYQNIQVTSLAVIIGVYNYMHVNIIKDIFHTAICI